MRFRIWWLCIVCSAILVGGQPSLQAAPTASPPPLPELESQLFAFRFEAAQQSIESLEPGPYQAYYLNSLYVYRYLATQETDWLARMQDNWKNSLDQLTSMAKTQPLKGVMLAELHCKRAALEFLEGNYLAALRYARQGRAFVLDNAEAFPNNPDQLKILGTFNVIFGAVPRKYQWITDPLGLEGDIDLGLDQLSQAAQGGSLLRLESVLFASYVEKVMLNAGDAALHRLQQERQQNGGGYLLDYFTALNFLQTKQNEAALQILRQYEIYHPAGVFPLPYWNYQLGKAYYYQDAQRLAQRYLARFLKAYPDGMYYTDAAFRLGMSLTLSGQYPQAKNMFQHIADRSHSGFDEDEYADFMSRRFLALPPTEAELTLFRARNAYDGGYYEKALQALQNLEASVTTLTEDEKTELYYRRARLAHSQDQFAIARTYYQKCLETSPSYQQWLQAYTLYYQGEIALAKNQLSEARTCYEAALKKDDYFYQSGLENRCKARLSGIKKLE